MRWTEGGKGDCTKTHVGRQVKHRMPSRAEGARAGYISEHNQLSEHLH